MRCRVSGKNAFRRPCAPPSPGWGGDGSSQLHRQERRCRALWRTGPRLGREPLRNHDIRRDRAMQPSRIHGLRGDLQSDSRGPRIRALQLLRRPDRRRVSPRGAHYRQFGELVRHRIPGRRLRLRHDIQVHAVRPLSGLAVIAMRPSRREPRLLVSVLVSRKD